MMPVAEPICWARHERRNAPQTGIVRLAHAERVSPLFNTTTEG